MKLEIHGMTQKILLIQDNPISLKMVRIALESMAITSSMRRRYPGQIKQVGGSL
jgi:hypothetical protein